MFRPCSSGDRQRTVHQALPRAISTSRKSYAHSEGYLRCISHVGGLRPTAILQGGRKCRSSTCTSCCDESDPQTRSVMGPIWLEGLFTSARACTHDGSTGEWHGILFQDNGFVIEQGSRNPGFFSPYYTSGFARPFPTTITDCIPVRAPDTFSI